VNPGSLANLFAFSTLTSHKLGERAIRKGDEVDILMRLANYGYKVFSTTKAVCYHEHIYEEINGIKVRFTSNNALFFKREIIFI
jgi:hypothetical protein